MMKPYRNLSGTSGVTAYEVGPDFIRVRFRETPDVVYLYDYESPGAAHVERMKALAEEGRGLSGYISQQVRERYRRKELATGEST
jgi:hypothetical protein